MILAVLLAVLNLPTLLLAGSSGQERRFQHDPYIAFRDVALIHACHLFLEANIQTANLKVNRTEYREFLKHFGIISNPKSKGGKKKGKSTTPAATSGVDSNIFSYPTCAEALELAFSALTAEEAVFFARAYPSMFYGASVAVLEAISDYSMFEPVDMNLNRQVSPTNSLLEIEATVKTMRVETLVYCLELNDFVLSQRAEELVSTRLEELSYAAISNLPLLYQYVLLHDFLPLDDSFFISKSERSISPAEHPVYGNLISTSAIIESKSYLSSEKWARLVFAYTVYTGDLMEQIFASIVKYYPKMVGFSEDFFIKFHATAITDLKRICTERIKLMKACENDHLRALLSFPLSKQVRDALKAVNSESIDLLVSSPVTPPKIQQWLWAYVNTDEDSHKKIFPFIVKSSKEILADFLEVFGAAEHRTFVCGPVVRIFVQHVLFGEEKLESGVKEQLTTIFAKCTSSNHAGMVSKFPELAQSDGLAPQLSAIAVGILAATDSLKVNGQNDDFFALTRRKRSFEKIVQFKVTSEGCLQMVQNDPHVSKLLVYYPELFGIRHLRFMATGGALTDEVLFNLTGNCFAQLHDLLGEFDYERMTRGLFAVQTERLKVMLRAKRFRLDNPIKFIECVNRRFFIEALATPSEESIEIINFYTAWLYVLNQFTDFSYYKPAKVLEAYYKQTRAIKPVLRAIIKWAIRMDLNYIHVRLAESVDLDVLDETIDIEMEARQAIFQLLDFLAGEEMNNPVSVLFIRDLQANLAQGTDSPNRISLLKRLKKPISLTLRNKVQEPKQGLFELATRIITDEDELAALAVYYMMTRLESVERLGELRSGDIPTESFKFALNDGIPPPEKVMLIRLFALLKINCDGQFLRIEQEDLEAKKAAKRAEIIAKLKAAGANLDK